MKFSKEIPIYDFNGNLVDKVTLPEKISYVSGRTSKSESGIFYKGAGVEYSGHCMLTHGMDDAPRDFDNIQPSEVPYISFIGEKKAYKGKTGIFLEKYQPYFSDYIGGCGPKEENLVFTAKNLPSYVLGIEVLDILDTPIPNHKIYKCECLSERNGNLPEPLDLISLIMFIIQGSWYCPWDKNLIDDIDDKGRIRDPADWRFTSKPNFTKALGTLYSLIYSLFKKDLHIYRELIKLLGLENILDENDTINLQKVPLICDLIIYRYNSDLVPSDVIFLDYNYNSYKHLFLDYIFECDPCCCLESNEFEWVKDKYKEIFLEETSRQ